MRRWKNRRQSLPKREERGCQNGKCVKSLKMLEKNGKKKKIKKQKDQFGGSLCVLFRNGKRIV